MKRPARQRRNHFRRLHRHHPRESGEPVHTNACVYWIPAFAGMTAVTVAPKQIISNTPSGRRFRQNPWRRYPSRPWPRNRISAARRADWSRRRNPPYALDRQIADLPVGQIDPRARRHLLCMFANSLMESLLRMVRCATTATTEARMLGLPGERIITPGIPPCAGHH